METILRFVRSKLFIFICSIYYFLVWVSGQEAIGLSIALLAASFLLISFKDMTGVATIMSLFITGVSLKQLPVSMSIHYDNSSPSYIIPLGVVILSIFTIALIVHLVRFKPSREVWRDPMTYCFFAIFLATILGGMSSKTFSFFVSAIISLLYFVLFLFYRMFKSCDPGFDFKLYAALIAVMLGTRATTDITVTYLLKGDFFTEMMYKSAYIGWGVANSLAPYIVIGIPMAAYLYIKTKNITYLFLSFIQLAGLVFTMCRGEIAAFALVSPALVFFLLRYAKREWGDKYRRKRFEFLSLLGVSVLIVAVVGIVKLDYLKDFIERASNADDNGRSPLRFLASLSFIDSPIFGGGFSAEKFGFSVSFLDGLTMRLPHSLLFNIFSTMGLLGAGVFATYYYFKYRQLLTFKSMFGVFAIISIVPFAFYAFADPTFYFVHIQYVTLLILEALRREAGRSEKSEYRISKIYREKLLGSSRSTCITLIIGTVLSALLIALFFMFGNEIYIINIRSSYIIMVGIALLIEITLLPSACRIINDFLNKRREKRRNFLSQNSE